MMMTEAIIIAFITGGCAIVSNIIVTISQGAKTQYRIEQLEKKVEKHNNLVERVTLLEASDKTQWVRIDELKEELKEEHGHE